MGLEDAPFAKTFSLLLISQKTEGSIKASQIPVRNVQCIYTKSLFIVSEPH